MFALRGMAVSFSIFILLYSVLSLVVCGVWRKLFSYGRRCSARRVADMLFTLRVTPFAVATGITLALAVPSFVLLEPRAVSESLGAVPVALGLCGLGALLAGAWKAATALQQASRTVARWSRAADASSNIHSSGSHVRRRDNLRKLILRVVAFPGMAELENAWREATEMAADDAAVSSASEALDLAAAVIKLSRLAPLEAPAELTTALVHSPAESVNARVQRLIAWTERTASAAPGHSLKYALCVAVTVAVTMAVTYSELLVRVHTATEWLVR